MVFSAMFLITTVPAGRAILSDWTAGDPAFGGAGTESDFAEASTFSFGGGGVAGGTVWDAIGGDGSREI